jgi:hypothetical protein
MSVRTTAEMEHVFVVGANAPMAGKAFIVKFQ